MALPYEHSGQRAADKGCLAPTGYLSNSSSNSSTVAYRSRAHCRYSVLRWPRRMDFSLALASLVASKGRAIWSFAILLYKVIVPLSQTHRRNPQNLYRLWICYLVIYDLLNNNLNC